MSLVFTANAATAGARRHSVYIGGKDHAKSLPKLEQWGISHILNVTPTKVSGIQVCEKRKTVGVDVLLCLATSKNQDSLHHFPPARLCEKCLTWSLDLYYYPSILFLN
jgi:hypothetical protein